MRGGCRSGGAVFVAPRAAEAAPRAVLFQCIAASAHAANSPCSDHLKATPRPLFSIFSAYPIHTVGVQQKARHHGDQGPEDYDSVSGRGSGHRRHAEEPSARAAPARAQTEPATSCHLRLIAELKPSSRALRRQQGKSFAQHLGRSVRVRPSCTATCVASLLRAGLST